MNKRPRPPTQTRRELLDEAERLVLLRYHSSNAIKYLLTFFTGVDLQEICELLKKEAVTDQLKKETGK